MTSMPSSSLIEYLRILFTGEISPPPQTAISREVYFKTTHRNWLGIKRARHYITPAIPTWDLLDSNGEDIGFCYVDKTGIAGKRTAYEDYGQIGGEYHPDLEDYGPPKREELYLLATRTIPPEKQRTIHSALQRLITV